MNDSQIINRRLINQQIAETKFNGAQELITWMAAMQAQDYAMAKWAIGLRLPMVSNADIERAFNSGDILRTHLLRPTWHFVTPKDIRWMLALTAPRVNAANAYPYRKLELDDSVFRISNQTFIKELQGQKHLTRAILKTALGHAGIVADGLRLGYLMMRAELDGIICSGPRYGKQFTYALLEERVPPVKDMGHGEALGELTLRYFASRGPATLKDFTYWSGLTMADAQTGIEIHRSALTFEVINRQQYIFIPNTSIPRREVQATFLMPDYDEYGMSYKDRSAIYLSGGYSQFNQNEKTASYHTIVIDGVIKGTWQWEKKYRHSDIRTTLFTALSERENLALENAIRRYKEFAEQGM